MRNSKHSLEKRLEDLESLAQTSNEIEILREEKEMLIRERDKAIKSAKLATITLIEAMEDFQVQIKSQQNLQRMVAELMTRKESCKCVSISYLM